MKGQLVADIRSAVRSELDKALENQQTQLNDQLEVLRSQAATPAPDSLSNVKNIKVSCETKIQTQSLNSSEKISNHSEAPHDSAKCLVLIFYPFTHLEFVFV